MIDKEWEKEFDKATFKQNNDGNPYFPDWEAVKAFIYKKLTKTRTKALKESIKALPVREAPECDSPAGGLHPSDKDWEDYNLEQALIDQAKTNIQNLIK